jgi:uncharacterized protein (TIGR02646 family)
MLKLKDSKLPHIANDQLRRWQAEIDGEPDYPSRVLRGKKAFSEKNKGTNKTFGLVRATVRMMAPGASRCAYCEDAYGDEVEHIFPKDFYPNRVFSFENYLGACGPCNGPKGNNFAIFLKETSEVLKLSSDLKPNYGDWFDCEPVLINPRLENPCDFLELDIWGTFHYVPKQKLIKKDKLKAKYTIELLKLNSRDYLLRARRAAYQSFLDSIYQYDARKKNRASKKELKERLEGLLAMPHPTVLEQIRRNSAYIPGIAEIFLDNIELHTMFWFD